MYSECDIHIFCVVLTNHMEKGRISSNCQINILWEWKARLFHLGCWLPFLHSHFNNFPKYFHWIILYCGNMENYFLLSGIIFSPSIQRRTNTISSIGSEYERMRRIEDDGSTQKNWIDASKLCIVGIQSWCTCDERTNGTNERNPKSRATQPNARGWELIINIVFGIMPQTIQSKCFIFWHALFPSQRTQCKNDSNISTFYICIYSNWNIFLLITIFVIKFFFSGSIVTTALQTNKKYVKCIVE